MSTSSIRDWWASEGVWVCGTVTVIAGLLGLAVEVPGLFDAKAHPYALPWISYSAKALTMIAGTMTTRLGSAISQSPNNSTGRI